MSDPQSFNEAADGPPDPKRLDLPLVRLDPMATPEERFAYMVDRLFEINENLRFLRAEAEQRSALASEVRQFNVRITALERAVDEMRAQLATLLSPPH